MLLKQEQIQSTKKGMSRSIGAEVWLLNKERIEMLS